MIDAARELLTTSEKRALSRLGATVQYPGGSYLFTEGQALDTVLVIEQGYVALSKKLEDQTEVMLNIRGPGEILGFESSVTNEPRWLSVKALTDVTALAVRGDAFMEFVVKHDVTPRLVRLIAQRLRESDNERIRMGRLPVRSRLALLLIELAASLGEEVPGVGTVITLPLSQADLATRIGATRVSVAKLLRDLREAEVLTTGRRQMVIHDLEALRRIAAS
ncbi:Crp/Fnr family transcriptional regulator [Streptomyces sp. NPDC001142]